MTGMPKTLRPVVGDLPLTYRQLDHWVRRGFINAPGYGSGHPREELDETERQVLGHMALLVADGVTPERAHRAARELQAQGFTTIGGHLIAEMEDT